MVSDTIEKVKRLLGKILRVQRASEPPGDLVSGYAMEALEALDGIEEAKVSLGEAIGWLNVGGVVHARERINEALSQLEGVPAGSPIVIGPAEDLSKCHHPCVFCGLPLTVCKCKKPPAEEPFDCVNVCQFIKDALPELGYGHCKRQCYDDPPAEEPKDNSLPPCCECGIDESSCPLERLTCGPDDRPPAAEVDPDPDHCECGDPKCPDYIPPDGTSKCPNCGRVNLGKVTCLCGTSASPTPPQSDGMPYYPGKVPMESLAEEPGCQLSDAMGGTEEPEKPDERPIEELLEEENPGQSSSPGDVEEPLCDCGYPERMHTDEFRKKSAVCDRYRPWEES